MVLLAFVGGLKLLACACAFYGFLLWFLLVSTGLPLQPLSVHAFKVIAVDRHLYTAPEGPYTASAKQSGFHTNCMEFSFECSTVRSGTVCKRHCWHSSPKSLLSALLCLH